MKQTFLLRTTGFDRSDLDVGFELFAIKLDGSDINKLLMLVDEAKRVAKFHPRFSFLVLKSDQGHGVSKEDLPANTLQRMQISHDGDTKRSDRNVNSTPANSKKPEKKPTPADAIARRISSELAKATPDAAAIRDEALKTGMDGPPPARVPF